MKKASKTFLQRKGRHNKHHDFPKNKGGDDKPENIFYLDENRHAAFHLLFGEKTFYEAARILVRAYRMKNKIRRQRILIA